MDDKSLTREERLAAKLRENLRRRKAQARALGDMPAAPEPNAGEEAQPLPIRESKS